MTARGRRSRARVRSRASFGGVLGELLITAGVVAMLFVVWQLWIGDAIVGGQKQAEADALAQQWIAAAQAGGADAPASVGGAPEPSGAPQEPADPAPPVPAAVGHGEVFGVMYVPRFGADWQYQIASGTTRPDILDEAFIGHYENTDMPGAVGNAAFAAHRWGHGALFGPMDQLVVGDAIVVQTPEGWYTYRFRNLEYVQPEQIEVLAPVPGHPDRVASDRILTLTTCAPLYNTKERLIAYALFDSFTPAADGPPPALAEGA
ncbi:class E sortase [Microbacterium sp. No. 7]|uniref:class E sortase n=1 Tax=Microbacterium sp. No. 7 TaxID=1714373 RepID=UPI0006CF31BD|nr:class E sortase [Microbacterium sp. No. 7]ALJ18473.1 sortase [Microbacterium sp. No. 7]